MSVMIMNNNLQSQRSEYIVNGWHLKKEVTIGQLVTLLALLISGLWWAGTVESRFTHISDQVVRIEEKAVITNNHINEKFDQYQREIQRSLGRIDRSIGKLSDKIDKKADK